MTRDQLVLMIMLILLSIATVLYILLVHAGG